MVEREYCKIKLNVVFNKKSTEISPVIPRHSWVITWKTFLSTLEYVMRDEDIANSRDIDDQRIDLSLERHNNRIVASVELMYMTENNLFSCYGRFVGRHPLGRPRTTTPRPPTHLPPPLPSGNGLDCIIAAMMCLIPMRFWLKVSPVPSLTSTVSCTPLATNLLINIKIHILGFRYSLCHFRCKNNCFLLLLYTINISMNTDLIEPPSMGTI